MKRKYNFGQTTSNGAAVGIICIIFVTLVIICIVTLCNPSMTSYFTNTNPFYSPAYTDDIVYTSPPGVCDAMEYSPAGLGTKCGGFLPLQGNIGELIYNEDENNLMKRPVNSPPGTVGGYPNYSDCSGQSCFGMQPFGMVGPLQGKVTNSYYNTGSNVRGTVAGQQNPNCQYPLVPTWPSTVCQNNTTLTNPQAVYGYPYQVKSFAS